MNTEQDVNEARGGGSELNDELDGCDWTQQDDWENSSVYDTACGEGFMISEETPVDNGMKFCCFCGKKLNQVLFKTNDA